MKATELLKKQHREVKRLFKTIESSEEAEMRRELLEQISEKLQTHMLIEEEIFYPAVAGDGGKKASDEMVPEAYEEHHVVKLILAELPDVDPEDERFEAKMTVLSELIDHHVEEEEHEMFKTAERLGTERLNELGDEMERRAGMSSSEIEAADVPKARRAT
jgi:iron-sulfur cluster repair protein YtfE (RIC family)